jgi:predicted nucleic acid-binding protein
MPGGLWLADTNVLLRWVQPQDPDHQIVRQAIQRLEDTSAIICYTSQNIGEFWNVLTRPAGRNGYGFTPHQADSRVRVLETRFRLLPDSLAVHEEWRALLVSHSVSGAQVHDARLAAAMQVHGVKWILTFNTRDFARFTGIQAVHPSQPARP